MSDTPKTDALREVIIGQYKEDELTGNGMGNILAALPDIESLEREREELKNQLIDAKSSTAFWMGKYNNAVQLRGKDPLCDSFWKTLDKLAAERALAEQRGRLYDTAIGQLKKLQAQVDELNDKIRYNEVESSHNWRNRERDREAISAWKEARND